MVSHTGRLQGAWYLRHLPSPSLPRLCAALLCPELPKGATEVDARRLGRSDHGSAPVAAGLGRRLRPLVSGAHGIGSSLLAPGPSGLALSPAYLTSAACGGGFLWPGETFFHARSDCHAFSRWLRSPGEPEEPTDIGLVREGRTILTRL